MCLFVGLKWVLFLIRKCDLKKKVEHENSSRLKILCDCVGGIS